MEVICKAFRCSPADKQTTTTAPPVITNRQLTTAAPSVTENQLVITAIIIAAVLTVTTGLIVVFIVVFVTRRKKKADAKRNSRAPERPGLQVSYMTVAEVQKNEQKSFKPFDLSQASNYQSGERVDQCLPEPAYSIPNKGPKKNKWGSRKRASIKNSSPSIESNHQITNLNMVKTEDSELVEELRKLKSVSTKRRNSSENPYEMPIPNSGERKTNSRYDTPNSAKVLPHENKTISSPRYDSPINEHGTFAFRSYDSPNSAKALLKSPMYDSPIDKGFGNMSFKSHVSPHSVRGKHDKSKESVGSPKNLPDFTTYKGPLKLKAAPTKEKKTHDNIYDLPALNNQRLDLDKGSPKYAVTGKSTTETMYDAPPEKGYEDFAFPLHGAADGSSDDPDYDDTVPNPFPSDEHLRATFHSQKDNKESGGTHQKKLVSFHANRK